MRPTIDLACLAEVTELMRDLRNALNEVPDRRYSLEETDAIDMLRWHALRLAEAAEMRLDGLFGRP